MQAEYVLRHSQILDYIYSPVSVRIGEGDEKRIFPCTGLWDTAAATSAISSRVVEALSLEPMEMQRHVTGINGKVYLNQYTVDLVLPAVRLDGEGIVAVEGITATTFEALPNKYQVDDEIHVLIGMDVIRLGDIALSHAKGRTEFRFRLPAQGVAWD